MLKTPWHSINSDKIIELLGSNFEQGLSPEEVQQRILKFGPNKLTPTKAKGPVFRFAMQFAEPLVYLLLAATVLTAWLGRITDSTVIFAVVLINALVGFL